MFIKFFSMSEFIGYVICRKHWKFITSSIHILLYLKSKGTLRPWKQYWILRKHSSFNASRCQSGDLFSMTSWCYTATTQSMTLGHDNVLVPWYFCRHNSCSRSVFVIRVKIRCTTKMVVFSAQFIFYHHSATVDIISVIFLQWAVFKFHFSTMKWLRPKWLINLHCIW